MLGNPSRASCGSEERRGLRGAGRRMADLDTCRPASRFTTLWYGQKLSRQAVLGRVPTPSVRACPLSTSLAFRCSAAFGDFPDAAGTRYGQCSACGPGTACGRFPLQPRPTAFPPPCSARTEVTAFGRPTRPILDSPPQGGGRAELGGEQEAGQRSHRRGYPPDDARRRQERLPTAALQCCLYLRL